MTFATAAEYEVAFRQACAEGKPPDALRRNAGPESERFFARTIPGPDGHTYWEGALDRGFRLDGGRRTRLPRWWWFERVFGVQERGSLGAVCGERNCITPEHQQLVGWAETKRRFTDEQMLGAIQVVALRLGRAPTAAEYTAVRSSPSFGIIKIRFGSWLKAVTAAGLIPTPAAFHKRGPEDCIAALQYLARELGHVPSDKEFRLSTEMLREAGLPTSTATIRTHLGRPWIAALRKAELA